MTLETEKREAIKSALMQLHAERGGKGISMADRKEIAEKFGVSTWQVNQLIQQCKLKKYRQWTEQELLDIEQNYDRLGPKILAAQYGVSRRAIITQASILRKKHKL